MNRIAQVNSGTEYFLGDALGSVRQMTNQSGLITYTRAYDPYGVTASTYGSSHSAYGYTSEYSGDSTQLLYLRARMYAPNTGRFLTRDTWGGNANNPMSYNKWNYVGSNPVNRTDPTGRCWYPKQGGGVNFDLSDPSPALCSWFINSFGNNGITIPSDATPSNWLNSISPEFQNIISTYTSCLYQNNWMLIRFGTSPGWEYYEARNTTAAFKLILGIGGGGSLSCESESGNCSLSGSVNFGEGFTIMGYRIALAIGGEGDWDIHEGTIDLGGTADFGNCTLYVSLFRISVSCGNYLDPFYPIEMGFKRDRFEEFLVVVKRNEVEPLGYEEFARNNLPFKNRDAYIYYQILDTDQSYDNLVYRHLLEQKKIFR